MSALAIFTCRQNSHPFQERTISLHEPVKIGRSVARARPTSQNAIFDCKVLSRNHAVIWYDNGKFYLQDTKSSNGTFVNNQRLSKGSEESVPTEIFSGDIIQFGVDVMENARRVTHSCIIAAVALYHADGQEAENENKITNGIPGPGSPVQPQELFQLSHTIQEAAHRERALEQKLGSIHEVMRSTQEMVDAGWRALIDEERLLSRVEYLENLLMIQSKCQTEDSLRQEATTLRSEKQAYEATAKETLRKVLEEKLVETERANELQRMLDNSRDECSLLQELYDTSQKQLLDMVQKQQATQQELDELQSELKKCQEDHAEELEQIKKENLGLEVKMKEYQDVENNLQSKVEELTANCDFTKEQLNNMQLNIESIGTEKDLIDNNILVGEGKDENELKALKESLEKTSHHLQEKEEELRRLQAILSDTRISLQEKDVGEKSLKESLEKANQTLKEQDEELRKLQCNSYDADRTMAEVRNDLLKSKETEELLLQQLRKEKEEQRRKKEEMDLYIKSLEVSQTEDDTEVKDMSATGKFIAFLIMIPMVLIAFGFVWMFYPYLSIATGTYPPR